MASRIFRIASATMVCGLMAAPMAGIRSAAAQGLTAQAVANDRSYSEMVSGPVTIELLKGDYFGFLEGPIWVPQGSSGYLLFIDIPANTIYKWTPDDKFSVYLANAGYTAKDPNPGHPGEDLGTHFNGRLSVVLTGPCGLALDSQGRVVMAAMGDRNVVRLEKDGMRTVLAARFEGKRFSGPNDIVVRSDGAVYFTDMISGLRYMDKSPVRELAFNGVFVLKDGTVRVIDKDPGGHYPNGITLSADEKVLYATGGVRSVFRYDVQPDGGATNGRLFLDFSKEALPGGPDGIRTDRYGNLWTGGPGGLWTISPEGKPLGHIVFPEGVRPPISFAFGDSDGGYYKSIYFVAPSSLYRMRGVRIPVDTRLKLSN